MASWPQEQQRYTLLHREGTKGFTPSAVSERGGFKCIVALFQKLPPLAHLGAATDRYTDAFSWQGQACLAAKPGRGEGVGDVAGLKLWGDIDPSDIKQGGVGDCWLLSGISSLAEFDGAIAHLFRKTDDLAAKPHDAPNTYVLTLWDLSLPTWREVDVEVDERLALRPGGRGGLLGCDLSVDGELWACYIEKAVAAHCGGWDQIDGGQCMHAWALLTGCKEQYVFRRDKGGASYSCLSKCNPQTGKWAEASGNAPSQSSKRLWKSAWPSVGGGGGADLVLRPSELFERMTAWDDTNFMLAASTKAGSDKEADNGIFDGHAYSVLTCLDNVAGTDIDLVKMRNPHGQGEITDGEFDDDGPGWTQYPQVKEALKPVAADDGVFWVDKEEFFQYFKTIYVCAKNMTAFIEA